MDGFMIMKQNQIKYIYKQVSFNIYWYPWKLGLWVNVCMYYKYIACDIRIDIFWRDATWSSHNTA